MRKLGLMTMKQTSVGFLRACATSLSGVSILILGSGPSFAGVGIPAPLVGVTGPVGLLVAGAAYGGYWLFRRYRDRA